MSDSFQDWELEIKEVCFQTCSSTISFLLIEQLCLHYDNVFLNQVYGKMSGNLMYTLREEKDGAWNPKSIRVCRFHHVAINSWFD